MTTRPRRWRSIAELARRMALEQEWLPLREAAALYRVTPETMLGWARQRCFSSRYVDGALWVSREELQQGLRRMPPADGPRQT